MSHWNHRILAHEHKGEITLIIHEVHYDNGKPRTYGEPPAAVLGETVNELGWSLDKMAKALTEPILWAGDKFPEEYDPSIS